MSTYFSSHNVGGGNIVTTGALNSGSITSGFGTIDTGSSTITTTGAVDFGAATVDSLSVSDANITNVGDIALDTISSDGSTVTVSMDDNTDLSFSVKEGSNEYMVFDTTDGTEGIGIGRGPTTTSRLLVDWPAISTSEAGTYIKSNFRGNNGPVTLGANMTTMATVGIGEPNVTLNGNTLTNAASLFVHSNAGQVATEATNNYAIWVDAGVSRFDGIVDVTDTTDSSDATGDTGALRTEGGASIAKKLYVGTDLSVAGDLDLNSTGELLNVAASGNDWTAANLTQGGTAGLNFKQTTTGASSWVQIAHYLPESGTGGAITLYQQGDGTGSANNMSYYWGYDAGYGYMKLRSRDTDGSSTDADIWRVTDGTEVMILNANHGSNFDYVCDGCGKSAIASFECCGTVAWHDDVQALDNMALSRSGLEHMAKIGVMEISSDDETGAEWIGLNLQPAQMFTWSAMRQMYQRINELETKLKALGA